MLDRLSGLLTAGLLRRECKALPYIIRVQRRIADVAVAQSLQALRVANRAADPVGMDWLGGLLSELPGDFECAEASKLATRNRRVELLRGSARERRPRELEARARES